VDQKKKKKTDPQGFLVEIHFKNKDTYRLKQRKIYMLTLIEGKQE
jgi:hypothetical protein